jgi:hypothetical protein
MSKDFSLGDRIRIANDYHWAKGALGTLIQPPDYVVNFADGRDGIYRNVPSLKGMLIFFGSNSTYLKWILTVTGLTTKLK